MADLEQRVGQWEREVRSIPEILDLQPRVSDSRVGALLAELDTSKREVRALPRILAGMLAERGQSS